MQCQSAALRFAFGLASLDAPGRLHVLLAWQFCFLLAIYLRPHWATVASTHPWFVLLEFFSVGMDFAPLYSTLGGFVPLALAACGETGMRVPFWFFWQAECLEKSLQTLTLLMLLFPEAGAAFEIPVPVSGPHIWLCCQAPARYWGETESSWSKLCCFQSCQWTWEHLALS